MKKLLFVGVFMLGFLCAVLVSLHAQDVKVQPPTRTEPPQAVSEKPLTELQLEKLKRTAAQIELLQAKYHIPDYQKELAPVVAEQEAIVNAACLSVGIPEAKIKTECALSLAEKDGDGKPLTPKVWRSIQPPTK